MSTWVDAGTCRRCRHTLWRVAGGLVAKSTMSGICGRRGRTHEARP